MKMAIADKQLARTYPDMRFARYTLSDVTAKAGDGRQEVVG